MPKDDWRDPGTKQGVYMIGPNSEYLEGGGAISGNAKEVEKRLRRALERWHELRREKDYANEEVPVVGTIEPPELAGKPLVFRVFLRDLPRGKGDDSGRRFAKSDIGRGWPTFTRWAWNVNWIAFDDPAVFLPKGAKEEAVPEEAALRICREVLVDNVRGQTPGWKREEVKEAVLTMRRLKDEKGLRVVEYEGSALMESDRQRYAPKLYGRATWDPREKTFRSFDLLAIGERAGHGTFNQRTRDQGPAPMGIALVLHRSGSDAPEAGQGVDRR